MRDDDDRRNLAAAQDRLSRALLGLDEAPAGFDEDRIAVAARSLAAKRRRGVAHMIPCTARSLGDAFAVEFDRYASGRPPPPTGPLADALGFVNKFDLRKLTDAARIEVVALLLRHGGRRFGAARLTKRLMLGWRLPMVGVGFLSIPMPHVNGPS